MKIKELFTDESKWTKGQFSRDEKGQGTPVKNGVCWCLVGAIKYCYEDLTETRKIADKIRKKIENKFRDEFNSITTWNDKIATFQDVKSLVEELDI